MRQLSVRRGLRVAACRRYRRATGTEGGLDAQDFIERLDDAGGTERQNSQTFLAELCDLIGVPRPAPGENADYAFEREVKHVGRGATNSRFMDLSKRGAFILESKQSHDRRRRTADPRRASLVGLSGEGEAPEGTPAWQRLMSRAFSQAGGTSPTCRRATPRRPS